MISYSFRAIDKWPDAKKQTPSYRRRSWPAKYMHEQTLVYLSRELEHAGAKGQVVIEAFVDGRDIRQDGMLRSDSRPSQPGVVLRFTGKHGAVTIPCDRYSHWKDNLRAIAKTLEALRAIDRWGTTYSGEQYRGWTALPPSAQTMSGTEAAEFIATHVEFIPASWITEKRDAFETAYKIAAKKLHPDGGGNEELFKKLQAAAEILRVHHGEASA